MLCCKASPKRLPEGFLGWKVIWQNPDFDLKDISFPFSKMPDDVVKEVVGDAAKQEAEKLPKEEKGAEPSKPETVEKEPELKAEREEEIVNPIKKQAESLSLEEKGKVKKPAEVRGGSRTSNPPTTPEILEWDAVTEEHFKNWLEAYIPEEDIATVEAGIREYVKDNPDILKTASWNRIRDLAEAEGYMIATREEAERIAKGEPEKPAETEKREAKARN